MHLAFVDIAYGYTADRPDADAPLGGTTSALCFLAHALVDAGHQVTIFNKIETAATVHNIPSRPLEHLERERSNPIYDAFIFCGRWTEWLVRMVQEKTTAPLVAWMHESYFGNKLVPAMAEFDAVAYVSVWQQRVNQNWMHPRQHSAVLRNAMNPLIADLFPPDDPILPHKATPPIAVYVGSAPRGLWHLPSIWPQLHRLFPMLTLQIFSHPVLGTDGAANDAFAHQLRAMPHVTHVGMVGQPALVQALRRASFYLGPNPWPETSCIALIESLAAGCRAITTNRAALPETAHGFAAQCPIAAADDPLQFQQPFNPDQFVATAAAAMREYSDHPAACEHQLRAQRDFFLDHYQWAQRVSDWTNFIAAAKTTAGQSRGR